MTRFVAGPCVIEDEATTFTAAAALARIAADAGIELFFKASFDKANRSSLGAFRGPGLAEGLRILAAVKERFGLRLLTDVHEPAQCGPVAEVCDVLQIPAFLCRQTDLVVEAAATGRVVNIKRGQFLDPRKAHLLVEKAGGRAWLTERGTAFGHGDLVLDPRSLVWMRAAGVPVLYDCTHTVQWPGAPGAVTGGHRELILPLARAAAAVGVDGYYAEVHPEPATARSDAATQLTPAAFGELVCQVLAVEGAHPRAT